MEGAPKRAVKCEKHGLHYDPATQSGCVICRREERGAGAEQARAAAPAQGADGSLALALGVALLLIGLATFALFAAHASVAAMLQPDAAAAPALGEPAAGMDARIERELQDLQQGAGQEAASAEQAGEQAP